MEPQLHRIQYYSDQEAFRDFYYANAFKLFQFAHSFIGSRELAEEIVNDVFLRLWQGREKLDKIRNVQVYLYVAVRNTAANYLRKISLQKTIDLDEVSADHFCISPDPAQVLITSELRKKIEAAINQLPPKCRLIFKMVKEDGLSITEVASILGLSYKTVSAQMAIALRKLQESLTLVLKDTQIRI